MNESVSVQSSRRKRFGFPVRGYALAALIGLILLSHGVARSLSARSLRTAKRKICDNIERSRSAEVRAPRSSKNDNYIIFERLISFFENALEALGPSRT